MEKPFIPVLIFILALTLLGGCSWQVGGGPKNVTVMPTTGQQLMDLQKARESGAITDAEYQSQKARFLGSR